MKTEIDDDPDRLSDGAVAAVAVSDGDRVVASCSLWSGGALGHFAAESGEAAAALFGAAEARLRELGVSQVFGPMDGNTWRKYRLVTGSDGRAPFFLEPQNPPQWPEHFVAAGWGVAARYTSSSIDLETGRGRASLGRVADRLKSSGVRLRQLRPDDYQEELGRIFAVSAVSFRENFLYSPISFEEFAAMYLKVQPLLVPEFSLLAEDAVGDPVGFVFALPEPTDPGGTIIVKTLAVLPQRRFAGLGSLLVERVHQAAREMGFHQAIHALQHQRNSSRKISSRHAAQVFREYTLYEKHL